MHQRPRFGLSATALLLGLVTGCSQDESGDEFVGYKQLAKSDDRTETAGTSESGSVAGDGSSREPAGQSQVERTESGDSLTQVSNGQRNPVAETVTQDVSSENPDANTGDSEASTDSGNAVQAPPSNSESEPREIRLLVEDRQFTVEGPEDANRVSFDDLDLLKVLNMEPVPIDAAKYLPEWLSGLEGKRIRLRGFMYPTFKESGIQRFLLARDNQICCFGRDPKVYDLVRIKLREGAETRYIEGRPFDVVGVFHVRPDIFDDVLDGLYVIDDAVVLDR